MKFGIFVQHFVFLLTGVYVGGGISFCLWSISDNFKSIKHKMKASKILFKEMAYLDTNKKPKCHSFTTDMLAKGQIISECPFDVLNFPKTQREKIDKFLPKI